MLTFSYFRGASQVRAYASILSFYKYSLPHQVCKQQQRQKWPKPEMWSDMLTEIQVAIEKWALHSLSKVTLKGAFAFEIVPVINN